MKVKNMRLADHYLGIFACFLLRAHRRVVSLFFAEKLGGRTREILVLKFFGAGSILLATPMLRAVKKKHPRARVSFLTFGSNREMCERISFIDEVISIDTGGVARFVRDVFRAIILCRRRSNSGQPSRKLVRTMSGWISEPITSGRYIEV